MHQEIQTLTTVSRWICVVLLILFRFFGVRKLRPKMTWMLFLEIFVLSLLG